MDSGCDDDQSTPLSSEVKISRLIRPVRILYSSGLQFCAPRSWRNDCGKNTAVLSSKLYIFVLSFAKRRATWIITYTQTRACIQSDSRVVRITVRDDLPGPCDQNVPQWLWCYGCFTSCYTHSVNRAYTLCSLASALFITGRRKFV